MLNDNCFWVAKLILTASGCYNSNVRLLSYSNDNLFSHELKILNYDGLWENKKISRMKIYVSLRQNWFVDIDWLISVDSLSSTFLTWWFDLLNHNSWERKHCDRNWLIKNRTLWILWDSIHILTRAVNNLCRPYGPQ